MTADLATNPSEQPKPESTNEYDKQLNLANPLADPNIKFPLENSWSFWFYKNDKSKEWQENVKFITTVDYVEDFWRYNYLLTFFFLNILYLTFIFHPAFSKVFTIIYN